MKCNAPDNCIALSVASSYCSNLSNHVDDAFQCDVTYPEAPCGEALCGSLRDTLSAMTTQHERVREDVQFRILRLLQDDPELSQRDLARAVGISTGGVHYLLTALLDKGLLKLGNFTAAADKRRYAYVLTPKGLSQKAALTQRFLARKRAEYRALKEEIEALEREMGVGSDPQGVPRADG